MKHQKEDRLHRLRHMAPTNTFLLNHLRSGGSASTTGTLGPDVEGKTHLRNKLLGSGISLPCRKRLTMLITIFFKRFHVTHSAGCAILFNKDAFYPDINVKSIYLHDTRRGLPDQIIEVEQGWVPQGVLSRASFRRAAVSGQKFFTVLSLHISNIYAKKKGVAKKLILTLRAIMISQEVDLVAGDVNGTAWRCRSRNNTRTIDEAFTDCALPTPPGATPLWEPGSIPNNWADVCGFLKPPCSQRFWKVNKHGALFIPRKALGLRPKDQICHHETWLHLDFVDWSNKWSNQDYYDGNIRLKERAADSSYGTQKRHISEVVSDHSLSS